MHAAENPGDPGRRPPGLRPRSLRFHRVLVVGLIMLIGAARLWDPIWIEEPRLLALDLIQRLHPLRGDTPLEVVVVDIDQESLMRHGQWPWPRSLIAKLLDACADAGALAVGFDMLFAERDRTSPAVWASQAQLPPDLRERVQALPSHEQLLAEAMGRVPTVLAWSASDERSGSPPPTSVAGVLGDPDRLALVEFRGTVGNLPELEKAAAGRGLISVAPEPDGLVRRLPALSRIGEAVWPTLGLELLRVGLRGESFVLAAGSAGLEAALLQTPQGLVRVPVTGDGRLWARSASPEVSRDRYISAAQLLEPAGRERLYERLSRRLVLVGSSFPGLGDTYPTPFGSNLPGAELHARLIETVMTGQMPQRPSWALAAELAVMALAGVLAALVAARLPLQWALLALGLLLVASWLVAFAAFSQRLWLLDPTLASLATLLAGAWYLLYGYSRSAAERRWIRNAFAQYLPEPVVEELARNPERLRLSGEVRELTVLFCDVRGFTHLSAGLAPEALGPLMNAFLTGLTAEIVALGGTIDKYIGDCVMALWNAPLSDPAHALHACHAALGMRRCLPHLNAELRRQNLLPEGVSLEIGVGIHTGPATVGNFGSAQRFAYTALGDTVNLASRLEGLCKTYGVDIVVSAATRQRAPEVEARSLGEAQVRGRPEPVEVYTLQDASCAPSEARKELLEAHPVADRIHSTRLRMTP